jgi:CRISPR-associated protein Cas1
VKSDKLVIKTEENCCKISQEKARWDRIIIPLRGGYVSLNAIEWLLQKRKSIIFLDHTGTIAGELHPLLYPQRQSLVRRLQYNMNDNIRSFLFNDLIGVKLCRELMMIEWMMDHYDKDFSIQIQRIEKQKSKIINSSKKQLLAIEANASVAYWDCIRQSLPEEWGFTARSRGLRGFTKPNRAKDSANALLNYAYQILIGEISRACCATGFDAYYPFYHNEKVGMRGFCYDVLEVWRFLAEKAIIANQDRFQESFFITDGYGIYLLLLEGVKVVLDSVYYELYQTTSYNNRNYPWMSLITLKLEELSSFLEGKRQFSWI